LRAGADHVFMLEPTYLQICQSVPALAAQLAAFELPAPAPRVRLLAELEISARARRAELVGQ
jgi:hypothetical protein